MFHPASLLLAWGGLVVLFQTLESRWLLASSALVVGLAFLFAAPLFKLMLRRIRWLFLAMVILFATMTPGVLLPAPWNLGVLTHDGVSLAAEHLMRLLGILGLLAVLLTKVEHCAIVAGLYSLLRPFSVCGLNRQRIAVRLLLTLDWVAADKLDWRSLARVSVLENDQGPLVLPVFALCYRDILFVSLALIAATFAAVLL
jgi:hypothetical protein